MSFLHPSLAVARGADYGARQQASTIRQAIARFAGRLILEGDRMIIKEQSDVAAAVLSELQRAPDARWREIMSAAVRHLHEFVREVRLSEAEFHQACAVIAR